VRTPASGVRAGWLNPAAFCLELSALSRPLFRLAVPLLSALCLVALPAMPTSPPVHLATSPAASGGWLARFNTWRANTTLPLLTENSTWSVGDYDHAVYMVKNDLVTHYETPGTRYYTTDGDTAARNSNIFVSSSTSTTDEQAIDWWMQAPFHAMGMMDPRLSQTGFGSYREVKSGWDMGAAVDVIRGNSFSGGQYPVYFPGNGATEPLTSYGGGEFPDPLQACPGYSVPTGLPVFIQVGGNVSTLAGPVHSFTGNGVPLNHCVIDSTNPAVGSYLVARGGVILIPQTPLQTGVKYVVALTVNGQPYTWSFTVGPFIGCPFVIASAAPPSPSAVGTTIKVVASATACANPLYEFWVLPPGGSAYQLLQAYSTNATFTWNTSGLAPGDYRFSVWARDANSTGLGGNQFGRWDAYDDSLLYTLATPACSGLSASASPPSPAGIGTAVTVSAQASGCPSTNPLYQFWVLPPGGNAYLLQQAYSTTATFTWNTSGLAPGDYRFSIWARDVSSSGVYGNQFGHWDTYNNSILYTLSACSGLSASAAPASPAGIGTTVTVTGQASGCPDPNPLYQFWVLPPGGNAYLLQQAYSTNRTFNWNTSGLAPGDYRFSIWARDANSTGLSGNQFGRWDTYNNSILYTLTAPACSGLSAYAAPASPAGIGTTVAIHAQAGGCTDPNPLYEFWVLPPGGTAYQLGQAYSTNPTFSWSTSGLAPGSYTFSIWTRDANSSGASGNQFGRWDAYNITAYTLTSCSGLQVSVSPASPAARGTTVTVTAQASGCPDSNPLYQFWVLAPGGNAYQLGQAYSTSSTFTWNTTGLAPGSYRFSVWVRDANSAGASGNQFGRWDAYNGYTVYSLS